jgi:hypothetical protein
MKTAKVLEYARMVVAGSIAGAAVFGVISAFGVPSLGRVDLSVLGAGLGAVISAIALKSTIIG